MYRGGDVLATDISVVHVTESFHSTNVSLVKSGIVGAELPSTSRRTAGTPSARTMQSKSANVVPPSFATLFVQLKRRGTLEVPIDFQACHFHAV